MQNAESIHRDYSRGTRVGELVAAESHHLAGEQEFQKLDAAIKKLAAKRAIEASNDRRPTAAYGQVATLNIHSHEKKEKRIVGKGQESADKRKKIAKLVFF